MRCKHTNGFRRDFKIFVLNIINEPFFYLNFIGETQQLEPLLILGGTLQFLAAPLLYLYIQTLVNPSFRIRNMLPHGIPFIFFCGLILYYNSFEYETSAIWIDEGFINSQGELPFFIRYYSSFLAFSSLIYPLVSLVALYKHKRRVLQEFSFQERITLGWLRHWVLLELFAFLISYVVIWAGALEVMDMLLSFKILAGLILVNIFVVGFFGISQPIIFGLEEEEPKEKYKSSALSVEEADQYVKRLRTLMEQEKAFLDPKLSIVQLASMLDISKHHLSQVLNDNLKTNFYDYVNRFRVEEFKRRIQTPDYDHLSLLGIAFGCGFNSKSSFNGVFKKLEQVTPSYYKTNLQK